jgi:hypothetical protein
MAKKDIIPTRDGDLDTFEENFKAKYPVAAAALGIDAGEITNTTTLVGNHRTAYGNYVAKKAEQKAAGEKNLLMKTASINEIRRAAAELKRRPGYTKEIGEELQIIGIDEDVPPTSEWRPVLKGKVDGEKVIIGFGKEFSDGIKLMSMRGEETEFTYLANDSYTPYYDTRPKLDAKKPENRQYQAWFILGDEIVGHPSDIITVTVE